MVSIQTKRWIGSSLLMVWSILAASCATGRSKRDSVIVLTNTFSIICKEKRGNRNWSMDFRSYFTMDCSCSSYFCPLSNSIPTVHFWAIYQHYSRYVHTTCIQPFIPGFNGNFLSTTVFGPSYWSCGTSLCPDWHLGCSCEPTKWTICLHEIGRC